MRCPQCKSQAITYQGWMRQCLLCEHSWSVKPDDPPEAISEPLEGQTTLGGGHGAWGEPSDRVSVQPVMRHPTPSIPKKREKIDQPSLLEEVE